MRTRKTVLCLLLLLLLPMVMSGCSKKQVNSQELKTQVNEFLATIEADGTKQDIMDRWYSGDYEGETLGFASLSGENGVIRFGTVNMVPFVKQTAESFKGIVPEMIYLFCQQYGYGLKFQDFSNTNSMVMAVSTGKIDMCGATVSITEERKKTVDFSDPYFDNKVVVAMNEKDAKDYTDVSSLKGKRVAVSTGGIYHDLLSEEVPEAEVLEYSSVADMCLALYSNKVDALVHDDATLLYAMANFEGETIVDELVKGDQFGFVFPKENVSSGDFGGGIADSLKRSFIEEDRWKQILQGVGCTLLITFFSVLAGLFVGFLLCMASRENNQVVLKLIGAFSWLIRGLPTVVLLLIMYYVVFGASDISGTIVAVISFTLIFAVTVYGLLDSGIRSIDRGQFEACAALGYKDKEGFMKIILPQVIRFALPGFKAEVIALIKATSIVGYIAVQDLTKTGDIIRASTYEPFAPLILTAIIYFVLAWVLTKIVDLIQKSIDKKLSLDKFLKGVDCHVGN